MRINAAETGLNRFINGPLAHRSTSTNNLFGNQSKTDTLQFSKFSGKLVIDGTSVASWNERITNVNDDKALQLMDRSISNIGNIMERIKSLTELATDESLTDEDRIDIQINLVNLNKELNIEKKAMSLRMAGQTESEIAENLSGIEGSSKWVVEMLERARERILNGEEWDVAEAYQQEYKVTSIEVQTPDGRHFFENTEDFALPPDINPDTSKIINHLAPDAGSMIVSDDPTAPTVSVLLAGLNIPMVMDAQSAKDALPKFEEQLNTLKTMKEEFAVVINETRMEELQAEQQGVSQLLKSSANVSDTSQPDENSKEQRVQTSIGEMVYADGDESNPILRTPQNTAGKMFAKLAKFFTEKLGNFSGTVIREGNFSAGFSNALPKINGIGNRKPQVTS
jgi:hypothetical protein